MDGSSFFQVVNIYRRGDKNLFNIKCYWIGDLVRNFTALGSANENIPNLVMSEDKNIHDDDDHDDDKITRYPVKSNYFILTEYLILSFYHLLM